FVAEPVTEHVHRARKDECENHSLPAAKSSADEDEQDGEPNHENDRLSCVHSNLLNSALTIRPGEELRASFQTSSRHTGIETCIPGSPWPERRFSPSESFPSYDPEFPWTVRSA